MATFVNKVIGLKVQQTQNTWITMNCSRIPSTTVKEDKVKVFLWLTKYHAMKTLGEWRNSSTYS